VSEAEKVENFLLDPYLDWLEGEGIPIVEDFWVDLLTLETDVWPRMGTKGVAVHLKGRGDFMSMFLIELAPGGQSDQQRHLFEEVIYVIEGHGSTTLPMTAASIPSNGVRKACSRCRSTPLTSISTARAPSARASVRRPTCG
jgi:hypothetical protein